MNKTRLVDLEPIEKIMERCFEGMITKDEAFDQIILLLFGRK